MNINPNLGRESSPREVRTRLAFFNRRRVVISALLLTILVGGAAALTVFSGRPPVAPPQSEAKPAPSGEVVLTAEQRAAAGIVVEPVMRRPHAQVFPAPGEIKVNEYATSNVSSRLRATIISRQAKLGDRVRSGQSLITLYSAEMAEAESAFVLASKTFARMSSLKAYISGQQFDEAQVKRDEARGRLQTYGLNAAEIAQLESEGLTGHPAGQFQLPAPQAGVITMETFRLGEVVEPGKTLFEVSNLSTVWVEARVSPEVAPQISGDRARVMAAGSTYDAKILQTLAQLNEATRTVAIRLQLDNPAGTLRPGEFVSVELFGKTDTELFVPTEAVLRQANGSWAVYVERADGAFAPVRVERMHAAGEETVIAGIAPGTRIATKGAFFVKSEADKASFGEKE